MNVAFCVQEQLTHHSDAIESSYPLANVGLGDSGGIPMLLTSGGIARFSSQGD
jgi:hypothetical protein